MGYTLNVDMWHWVNPETQKVIRLSRGDEVPQEVLDQEGIDIESMTNGRAPQLLKTSSADAEQAREERNPAADSTAASGTSPSPKRVESK